jgi:hypothetical protein
MTELKLFQNDVERFYKKLISHSSETKIYYKIFYSKFYKNADILFIGINPGNGELIQDVEEANVFEYLKFNDYDDYDLSRETKIVFKNAEKQNLLKGKVVKTNYYYLATENEKELYNLMEKLSENIRLEFYKKSFEWTQKIIKLVNPKVIICEGKRAYLNVLDSIDLEIDEIKNHKTINSVSFKNSDTLLLGYSRRFSRILNKNILSEIIKEII